jgi:AcrR family transcriptional regulator
MGIAARREALKEALVSAAEQTIAARGLGGLRARELAAEAGCAVGAIYNIFEDLDDLVLAVNGRTLRALERALSGVAAKADNLSGPEQAIDHLVRMAGAYLDFAVGNTFRWRALFEHRLPPGKDLPDWYLAEQAKLFCYIERPLEALTSSLPPLERAKLARSVFSAVHGLVTVGLEEKLGVVPLSALRSQIVMLTKALGRGLSAMSGSDKSVEP